MPAQKAQRVSRYEHKGTGSTPSVTKTALFNVTFDCFLRCTNSVCSNAEPFHDSSRRKSAPDVQLLLGQSEEPCDQYSVGSHLHSQLEGESMSKRSEVEHSTLKEPGKCIPNTGYRTAKCKPHCKSALEHSRAISLMFHTR